MQVVLGSVVLLAITAAVTIGLVLWLYKRSLGQERKKAGLATRAVAGVFAVIFLINFVNNGNYLLDHLDLVATWLSVIAVGLVATWLIRRRPDLSRTIIVLAMALAGIIVVVGTAIHLGPDLDLSASLDDEPVLPTGRIEMPETGFAVTFPDDWTVRQVTPEAHAQLFSEFDAADRALRTALLYAEPPESDGDCTVVDFTRLAEVPPAWTTISAATGEFLAGVANDPRFAEPQSTIEDLPAGRTGHITATDTDGWYFGAYFFTDGAAWLDLDCWSPDPPDDGWLSIAETFESLPAEE
ncbi:MAG: hypothetical protein R6W93_07345 [Candidatus Limnocylindrales bacterium]